LAELIKDEVNVKQLRRMERKEVHRTSNDMRDFVELDTRLTTELKEEGMIRDVVRHVQQARKEAGLQVSDRIVLTLDTDNNELKQLLEGHATTIKAEALADSLLHKSKRDGLPVRVEGAELYVHVVKK